MGKTMRNSTIRTIIIDDEEDGRDIMQALLEKIPEVQLMAVCDGADSGLESILQLKPDLVFLDIQMPKKNGIDVVKELHNHQIKTTFVFVTAYDKYAIQAIKLAAFDFLLKPVDPDELHEVIRKFQSEKIHEGFDYKIEALVKQLNHEDRIRLNTRTGFILVDPSEIIYIQADGNYSEIIFSKTHKELVTQNIGALIELLSTRKFLRASRSEIINLSYLRKFDRKNKECVLEGNGEAYKVHISRNMMGDFDKLLK